MKGYNTVPVDVQILEVEWLSDCMPELYRHMSKEDDNEIFGNEFIKILLEGQNYSSQIFYKMFIPYMIYHFLIIIYLSSHLIHEDSPSFMSDEYKDGHIYRIVCVLFIFGFLGVEVMQMINLKGGYFDDAWNALMVGSFILNLLLIFEHVYNFMGTSYDYMIEIASVAIVIQWLVLYYWFRLFPSLAFFVTFLKEVLYDICGFVVMFLVCILMFGNAIYVIQTSHGETRSEYHSAEGADALIPSAFNTAFIDSMLAQYQITIGMGEVENFTSNPIVWVFYLLTTLWTQLTFFNMLIGIMGLTFERVVEAKDRNSLMERTKMYADFLWVLTLDKELKGKRYLYIVQPSQDEGESNEANLSSIKRTLKNMKKSLHDQIAA